MYGPKWCVEGQDEARCVRIVVVSRGQGERPRGVPPWAKKNAGRKDFVMHYYPEHFKKAMVLKMSAAAGQSATSLAKEAGIAQTTLSRWLREYATVGMKGEAMAQRRPQDWSAEEKLEAILEYERTPEEQRGVFLRQKGLHEATLERWKKETLEGLKIRPFAGGKKDPQRKRIAALERELRRKEAALAEAAALLVLKKKADALWGEPKDER
jgi:transposase-like protein